MLIQKEWRILDDAIGSAPLPERILKIRQLDDPAARAVFLHPSFQDLHDPMRLPDMDRACQAIAEAIETGRRIVVHGDYDVDGLTATALLVRFLRRNGIDCEPLIPDRLIDGYGLSDSSVARARSLGAGLLITVDCGVTSLAVVAELMASGIDVVITDHHECPEQLPSARAVVNPKRSDSVYPAACLSGVGVTFKLIEALCITLHLDGLEPSEFALIALGTVADVVPLFDENRVLVQEGLRAINRHLHVGLTELLKICVQQNRTVDATTIGYSLAPRLNAAGRLGAAMPALELLLTDDAVRASQLAEILNEQNQQRQALEAAILEAAIEQIETQFDFSSTDLIILAESGWHTGVVGIVCSRLVDRYHRPVIVFGGDGHPFKGSARTCGQFDLLEAIRSAAAWTRKFGGHKRAAGIEVDQDQLTGFCQAINKHAAQTVQALDFRPETLADALVAVDDLTEANALALSEFAPFGEGNRLPLLVCRDLVLTEWRLVGNGKHVRLSVQGPGQRPLVGIAFNLSGADDLFAVGDRVDLLFALEISEYLGRRSVQMHVRDIHPAMSDQAPESGLDRLVPDLAQLCWLPKLDLADLARRIGVDADQLIPGQQDFVTVYQYLRATYADRPVQTDLSLLARRIARSYQRDLNGFRLALVLRVFAEISLLQFQPLGKDRLRIDLTPADPTIKVRLADSPAYQLLIQQGETI